MSAVRAVVPRSLENFNWTFIFMLPADRTIRYFASENRKGISCKLAGALEMALLFSLVEIFLGGLIGLDVLLLAVLIPAGII